MIGYENLLSHMPPFAHASISSCALALIFLLRAATAAPGDERWGREFYSPDFNSGNPAVINAITFTTSGHFVCGGTFAGVAGVTGTQNLAQWDGTNWLSLGGGLPGGTVYATLAVGADLYLGGNFTSIQGQNITNLARWDGTNWHAVGGGVTGGSVRALAWHAGALCVGGLFTNAGGNFAGYVATWNGASWNTLGGGVQAASPSGNAVPVLTLLSDQGSLYAGGVFFSAGGVAANNIARWNGAAWEALGTGANNGVNGVVAALGGTTNGLLYIGGNFVQAGTNTVNHIAAWNGTTWSSLAGGVSDNFSIVPGVSGLLVSGVDLLACGNFILAGTNLVTGLARWDGAQWFPVVLPGRHPISRITAQGSRTVVAGRLQSLMVPSGRTGLIQYDGAEWSILGGGLVGSLQTIDYAGSRWQASGRFGISDGSGTRPMVAQWSGKGWTNLGNGLPVQQFSSQYIREFLTRDGLSYAAGDYGGGVTVLSNNTWSDLGGSLPGTGQALAFHRGELFAGHSAGISRWTGGGWTNVGEGLNGGVSALLVLGDELYAGGTFTNSRATPVSNVARWDGTNWAALGLGVNGPVRVLGARQNELYVAGQFTEAGGVGASSVARWSNGIWSPLGAGLTGGASSVAGLAVLSDGRVFAAGNFTQSGVTGVNRVASWDGTNWGPLGSGLNAPATSLATDGTDLFFAGAFTTAGGGPSLGVARWRLSQNLRLGSVALTNETQVALSVRGEPGTKFAVETSGNLTQWLALSTNSLEANPAHLLLPTNGPQQFYRLRRVP